MARVRVGRQAMVDKAVDETVSAAPPMPRPRDACAPKPKKGESRVADVTRSETQRVKRTHELHLLLLRISVLIDNLHLLEDRRLARLACPEQQHLDNRFLFRLIFFCRLLCLPQRRTSTRDSRRGRSAPTFAQSLSRARIPRFCGWPLPASLRHPFLSPISRARGECRATRTSLLICASA